MLYTYCLYLKTSSTSDVAT